MTEERRIARDEDHRSRPGNSVVSPLRSLYRLRLRPYLELLRLPNLFTAMADVAMGVLFVRGDDLPHSGWLWALLLGGSCLLYAGGVVLNDVCDFELDAIQRPERPLPSGRIARGAAKRLSGALLLLGVVAAWGASWLAGNWRPGAVALLLLGGIIVYDRWLKPTPLGPPVMGACRFLNVLLGMSLAAGAWRSENWLVAASIGAYVTGLSWFARNEAAHSRRLHLALAAAVMLGGVALLAWLPSWSNDLVPLLREQPDRWHLLMLVLGFLIVWRSLSALIDPTPSRVQTAVSQGIFSLVMLDACACFAVRGMAPAVMIMLLLVPTVLLAQWIRPT